MTLDEFVEDMREQLRIFKSEWEEKSKTNPDNFPMSMGAGDWEEQFFTNREEEEDDE